MTDTSLLCFVHIPQFQYNCFENVFSSKTLNTYIHYYAFNLIVIRLISVNRMGSKIDTRILSELPWLTERYYDITQL